MKHKFIFTVIQAALFLASSVVSAHAESVTLAWDTSTPAADVAGYEIRYGQTPGTNTEVLDVGNVLAATIPNLEAGRTYYFRARAYNAGKTIFSGDSNEVAHGFTLILTAPINLRVVVP